MDEPVLRDPEIRRTGPRGEKGKHWVDAVTFLKQHPDEWALLGEFSTGVAPAIRRGEYPAFIPEGFDGDRKEFMEKNFEVTVNTIKGDPSRRTELFARYIGG